VKDYLVSPAAVQSAVIEVPGDKSISHRALMLGGLSDGTTEVEGLLIGDDCMATLAALRAMGVEISQPRATAAVIHGVGMHGLKSPASPLDLGNSGTGMRLFAGLLSGQAFDSTLTGDESLSSRPMKRVITPLTMMGAEIGSRGGLPPLEIKGGQTLSAIDYSLPVASAQVKSAILLAGLYARGDTVVREPAVTRDHTERMLRSMGVSLNVDRGTIHMPGQQSLRATTIAVPGDLSSAAFFIVAALLGEDCELFIRNVGVNPTRTGVIDILRDMGGRISVENPRMHGEEPVADLRVQSSRLRGIDVAPERVSLAIDEFPILFVAAAAAEGTSRFAGLEELRVKESDRIAAMVSGLRALGVTAQETDAGAEIVGGPFAGGAIDSHGDHRIAMSFAVAATRSGAPVRIRDVAAVNTSFPGFDRLFAGIGADIDVVDGRQA
jgi:3-phosphoshikimate 1-carboxyvinyltransferase